MDSKLKRLTILVALSILILVGVVVVFANQGQTTSNKNGVSVGTGDQDVQGTDAPSLQDQEDSGNIITGRIGNDLSAFLKDDSFFDDDRFTYLSEARENENRLFLVVTSIEKDLRIQIVDNNGALVTGESYYVTLNEKDEYKDLDKDGIIYIGDLKPGEYEVSLKPIEGYKVPLNSTKVKVKEQVEYLVIDDISILIKTEEQINAEEEDTQQAVEDKDKTEIKKMQAVSGKTTLGIDVSKWNKEIDWDKVKAAGVDYAIIRCGYRGSTTGSLVEDPYFSSNMKGAIAAGVKVGVYFFTQAINDVEAVEEASMVVSLIKDYNLTYPVFIDTEGAGGNGRADGLDVATRTSVIDAFCATIENAGYQAGVYASRNWYNNRVEASSLDKYVIWLAEYRSVPLYQGYYQMWQYTSQGKIDGISGKVDMNLSYLGY